MTNELERSLYVLNCLELDKRLQTLLEQGWSHREITSCFSVILAEIVVKQDDIPRALEQLIQFIKSMVEKRTK